MKTKLYDNENYNSQVDFYFHKRDTHTHAKYEPLVSLFLKNEWKPNSTKKAKWAATVFWNKFFKWVLFWSC